MKHILIIYLIFSLAGAFHTSIFKYRRINDPKQFLPLKCNSDENEVPETTSISTYSSVQTEIPIVGLREDDLEQIRDLDLILTERSRRFYDPKLRGMAREACLLVAVETKQAERAYSNSHAAQEIRQQFTFQESLSELAELVGTAGLQVHGVCIQKLSVPNIRTYVGPGKIADIMLMVNETNARTVVVDDDLTPKQQLSMESVFAQWGGKDVKILDRTALILEIFAQHARTREGQVQVELAQLQYRLTRGPSARGDPSSSDVGGKNSGAGFRGPGETKLETDKRAIRDKIVLLKRELQSLDVRREQHRKSRARLGLPVVALVGYTNAGKSSLLNVLSKAGVLAENMLFATLDNTIRKVRLDRGLWDRARGDGAASGMDVDVESAELPAIDSTIGTKKGQEVLISDTVGFISKLPTDLIAAFRATLDEVKHADVLIHVCDRSSPVWEKQRETVLRELDLLGADAPIVELWNKVDLMDNPEDVMVEAACLPVEVEGEVREWEEEVLPERIEGLEDEAVSVDCEAAVDAETGAAPLGSDEGSVSVEDDDSAYITETDYTSLLASIEPATALAPPPVSNYEYVLPAKNPNGNRKVRRTTRKTFTVAASLKTGLGFDDFIDSLVDALSLRLKEIEVFIPYSKDEGLIAAIHTQGVVLELEYANSGTRIACRVPPSLKSKLTEKGFRVRKGVE